MSTTIAIEVPDEGDRQRTSSSSSDTPDELRIENLQNLEDHIKLYPENEMEEDVKKTWEYCKYSLIIDGAALILPRTILHYLAAFLLPHTMGKLCDEPAAKNILNIGDDKKRTPLYTVVTAKERIDSIAVKACVQVLLNSEPDDEKKKEMVNYKNEKTLLSPLEICLRDGLDALEELVPYIQFEYELPENSTWLHKACSTSRDVPISLVLFVAEVLRVKGGDSSYLNQKDGKGFTAIYYAVKYSLLQIVKMILKHDNVDISEVFELNKGRTVIHVAAMGGRTITGLQCFQSLFNYIVTRPEVKDEVVTLLYQVDSEKKSVLQYICQYCPEDVVEECVEKIFPKFAAAYLYDARIQIIYDTPQILEYILNRCFSYPTKLDEECDVICNTKFITGDEDTIPEIRYLHHGVQLWNNDEQKKILTHPAVQVYIYEKTKEINGSLSVLIATQILWLLSISIYGVNQLTTGYKSRGGFTILCATFVLFYIFKLPMWYKRTVRDDQNNDVRVDGIRMNSGMWGLSLYRNFVTVVLLIITVFKFDESNFIKESGITDFIVISLTTTTMTTSFAVFLLPGGPASLKFESIGMNVHGLVEILWMISVISLSFNLFIPTEHFNRVITILCGSLCWVYILISTCYELVELDQTGRRNYNRRLENLFQNVRNFLLGFGIPLSFMISKTSVFFPIVKILGSAGILITYCLSMRHFRNVHKDVGLAIEILKQVLIRIFKVFVSCSSLLIGFAVTFLIMYSEDGKQQKEAKEDYLMKELNVSYIGPFLKMLVLMTGELDYSSASGKLDYPGNYTASSNFDTFSATMEPIARQLLLIVFIIGVLFAYFNQLTGVAIEGVREIEIHNHAETSRLARKVEYIFFVESMRNALQKYIFCAPRHESNAVDFPRKLQQIRVTEPCGVTTTATIGWRARMAQELSTTESLPTECYKEMHKLVNANHQYETCIQVATMVDTIKIVTQKKNIIDIK